MSEELNRRNFVGGAAAAGAALYLAPRAAWAAEDAPANRLRVGVIGTGGRGTALSRAFQQQQGVDVAYVCDVDSRRVKSAAEAVRKLGGSPQEVGDLRRVLDDKSIDAVAIATPNHWHAPATILACSAGKHVYVEKPCSHNPQEGEWMVQAARKNKRCVQLGTQRRSYPAIIEGIERLQAGDIGRVYAANSGYWNVRGTIGHGKTADAPAWLDYELWQGPAPRRPFQDNTLHYNWHWFWHWGNGEAGNNGVHMLDVCRWGLGVDYPTHVTSAGGRYRYDDDQETPDTNVCAFQFDGGKLISWEGYSCNRHRPEAITFRGEKGALDIHGGGYTLYDARDKEIDKKSGPGGTEVHVANFLQAIRDDKPESLNAEIEEGHKSTLLTELANIACRTGRALRCDPKNGHILDDAEAMKLWRRDYAPGWEPKV